MKAVNFSKSFGMLMPGRSFSSSNGYRFGFNGKEKDNEVSGDGNWQDYGMRPYSTRLVRFPCPDPLFAKYPMLSVYQFASNTPIMAIDQDGKEAYITISYQFHNSEGQVVQNGTTTLVGGVDYPMKPGTENQAIIKIVTDSGNEAKIEEHTIHSPNLTIKASDYNSNGSRKSIKDKVWDEMERQAESHPVCGASGMENVSEGIEKVGDIVSTSGLACGVAAPAVLSIGKGIGLVGSLMKITAQHAQKKDQQAIATGAALVTKLVVGETIDKTGIGDARKMAIGAIVDKAVDKVNDSNQSKLEKPK